MKAGAKVVYVDKGGHEHMARIVAVTGSGPSGYKVITVSYSARKREITVEDVVNERDSTGDGHWT